MRAAVMGRMAGNLGKLRRAAEAFKVAFGKDYQQRALTDERARKSLKKEAAFREAARRAELEDAAMARHEGILGNPDLAKLKSNPVHEYLSLPGDPLHGRLMSPAAAIARGENFFDPKKHGDFDGADGVSRTVFGGTLMPDQAAQELFAKCDLFEGHELVGLVRLVDIARAADDARALGREFAEVDLRGLVGAVLGPHHREDAQLDPIGLAAQPVQDHLILIGGQTPFDGEFGGSLLGRAHGGGF
jgi:hypothetical protein